MTGRRAVILVVLATLAGLLVQGSPAGGAAADFDPGFGEGGRFRFDRSGPSVDVANAVGGLSPFVAGAAGGHMGVAPALGGSPQFGSGSGRVTVDFGVPSVAHALVEGDVLYVAGAAGGDFAVAAMSASHGDPELRRGDGGRARVSFGAPSVAYAATTQHGLLLGGTTDAGAGGSVALARLDLDLGPAAGFGSGGTVVDDLTPGRDAVHAMVDTGAGTIAVGEAGGNVLVALYRPDGTPHPDFGAGGRVILPVGDGPSMATGVDRRPDGSGFVVAGTTGDRGFVARFDDMGALDAGFGSGGIVLIDAGGRTAVSGVAEHRFPNTGTFAAGTVATAGGVEAFVLKVGPDGSRAPNFGADGLTRFDLGGPADVVGGIKVEGTALLVVGGDGADMIVQKVDSAGVPVPAESAGRANIDFGPRWEAGHSIALQPDGRAVVAGGTSDGMVLIRLLPDGRLDPTFRPGRPIVREVGRASPSELVLQPDGKILVTAQRAGWSSWVFRFLPSGEIDLAFGQRGETGVEGAGRIVLQPDGRILTSGRHRLLPDGTIDPTFTLTGADGFVPRDIALRPDGGFTVLGQSHPLQSSLFGFGPTGTRQSAFGGSVGLGDTGQALARGPDGRYFVAGRTSGSWLHVPSGADLAVAGMSADGFADPTFGDNGIARFDLGGADNPADVAVQPDGRVVVLVTSSTAEGSRARLARFLPNGRLDRSFGIGGVASVASPMSANAMALAPDGTVLVTGQSWNGMDTDLVVVRYRPTLTSARTPHAAGWNVLGQLGDGTTSDRAVPVTAGGPLDGNVTAVAAGLYHSLALRNDATVWAWGWNGVGQLGDGTTVDRKAPVPVAGLADVVAIAAGAGHSLALKRDGTVWSWGWNPLGQLGDGTTVDRHTPVRVVGVSGITALAAGTLHSLALHSDGTLRAWGWNGVGQLGDQTTVDRHRAVTVNLKGTTAIAAGAYHSLAVRSDGIVSAWGWNAYNQLGVGPGWATSIPTHVPGLTGVVAVAGGGVHSLALRYDGRAWAWGSNGVGQVGDGTTVDRVTPTAVRGLTGVVAIAAGSFHNLAVRSDGSLAAWGWNPLGQHGTGNRQDALTPVPVPVPGGPHLGIAGGGYHSLFL
jgi:uncharacterized delta-60 repeat protein